MTDITISKSENEYCGFECKGHSGFADAGRDIVCAAISMLTINTINSIEAFTNDRIITDSDEKTGYISCSFPDGLSDDGVLLMKSYELGVTAVSRQYGKKFLKINFKEV